MEKYIIKHGSENWFLQNQKSKVKWSNSLSKARYFNDVEDVLDVLNNLNVQKNIAKPCIILTLNPISEEKLKYIMKNYKKRDFDSTDIY